MTYYYYDAKDGFKQKEYEGDPVFSVRVEAEGSTRFVYASADRAKQHLYALLENPPMNLSRITYGIETPAGDELFIK